MFRSRLSARRMPPYKTLEVPPNLVVMSAVGKPEVAPGTMALSAQVRPPSLETKIGAKDPPVGLGVKAVAAICSGLFGFTARLGSLS